MQNKNENLLTREEVIDGKVRICGYRYTLLNPRGRAQDYVEALRQAKVKELAERRLPLICITPAQWREADFTPIIGANTLFQLNADSVVGLDAELLLSIRGTGAGVVLADVEQIDPSSAEFQHATAVMIDFTAYPHAEFASRFKSYRNHWSGLDIAVENLPDWNDQGYCLSMGAKYTLGSFVFTEISQV